MDRKKLLYHQVVFVAVRASGVRKKIMKEKVNISKACMTYFEKGISQFLNPYII